MTANTSKASSLFSDRIPASMMREPVQTLCYRARNAEMLFSWNDEAPVWAPKFRALLHEASCTSFFSASVTLVEYIYSCHGFRTLSQSRLCGLQAFLGWRSSLQLWQYTNVFALSNNTLANNAASSYGGTTINDEACDLIQSLDWHGS